MNPVLYSLPIILALSACAPELTSQRVDTIDGNKLQVTSGIMHTMRAGRYVTIENVDKRWVGKYAGGKEKWKARANLLDAGATKEIETICGSIFYHTIRSPFYNMMDKDETMGGMAPILGVAASMAAYAAAYSATDAANVPISIYTEFSCPKDEPEASQ